MQDWMVPMRDTLTIEWVPVTAKPFIYRVNHRIMEGDCQYDHGPRLVSLADFQISKYPITNAQFAKFLNESGYVPKDAQNFLKAWGSQICPTELLNHPVTWVSPSDARAFCEHYGFLLPSDEQWQYAAAGDEKRKWPWGQQFKPELCNANGKHTTPVDSFPENRSPFGCVDLCGNVYEWTSDLVDDGMHLFTFARGGSYYCAPHFWHAEGGPKPNDFHLKVQLLNEALNRAATVGFRCVSMNKEVCHDS